MSFMQTNLARYEETPFCIDNSGMICEEAGIYAEGIYTPCNAEDSPCTTERYD